VNDKKGMIFSDTFKPIIIFIMMIVLMFILFSFFEYDKGFLTSRNMRMLFTHMSISAITALGLTYVIAVGHFDMSFYLVGCLAAMTTSYLNKTDLMMNSFMLGNIHAFVIPAVLAGIAVGCLWGLISGIAVGIYKLDDMVTTIGTGFIAFGMAYLYTKGSFIYDNFLSSGITEINDAKWFTIPFPIVLMVGLYFISYLVLSRSKYGRCFYATGGNKVAAVFSGVRVKTYIIIAFIVCAGFTSLAAIMTTAAQGVGNVKASLNFLMPAYAAVYIGIAVFKKPTVIGTFFGALFSAIMLNGFTLMALPFYLGDLIIAAAMIIAIMASKIDWASIKKKKSVPAPIIHANENLEELS
jgi:ribose/xylose/arabinose/galactoside ABC-type transport system permease subunit